MDNTTESKEKESKEKSKEWLLKLIKKKAINKDLNLMIDTLDENIIKDGKEYKSKDQIKKLNISKKKNFLVKLIKENKINIMKVLDIKFNKKYKLTLDNIDNTDMFLKYLKSNHPLDLATFLNDNRLKNFNNECELKLEKINNNKKGNLLNDSKILPLKSDETFKQKKQGLYILSVCIIDNIWKIIKLGSFAETQGLCGRLSSFGGGSYDTGSKTNQLFIKYVSFLLKNNMRVKFNYYLKEVKPIIIEDPILKTKKEIIPYLMRLLESEIFKIYFELNKNRNPIFGDNCT